jgi:hypothetical protein
VTLLQIAAETGISYNRVWKYVTRHAPALGAHKAKAPQCSRPIWVVPRESADELAQKWGDGE